MDDEDDDSLNLTRPPTDEDLANLAARLNELGDPLALFRAKGPASYQPMATSWVTESPRILRANSPTHQTLDGPPNVPYHGLSALGIPWVGLNLGRWPDEYTQIADCSF